MRPFVPLWLGSVPYADAFALQRDVHAARVAGDVDDTLILLEHPPTITHSTTGRGSENVVASAEQLAARGVVIEGTDRGGNVTFHGPGQLVGYPIVALGDGERDLHRYLRNVEEVLIRSARALGVETARVKGRTGTWVDSPDHAEEKLAAIGVKCSRWTTLHGFAMNVTTDLSFFDLIVPCGIEDAGVVSLERLMQRKGQAPPSLRGAVDAVVPAFADVFGRVASPPNDRLRMLCAARGAHVEPLSTGESSRAE